MLNQELLKVDTTFSGIGAPEQALKNLGIAHVVKWACDIDKHAKQTYFANHTCEKWYDDITTIDIDTLEYVDLYIFGFPCQDVSFAGKRNLERGRTALVEHSLNIIDKISPKYIIFENVKGLLSKKFEQFFHSILNRLNINYNLSYKVLNSKNYGIPHNRERIFCIGIRRDINQKFIFPPSIKTETLHNFLEKDISEKYTLSDQRYEREKERLSRNQLKGNGFGYRIIKDYIYCLRTTYGRLGDQFIEQFNQNPRFLTPRECARLQGYPDSFILPASDEQSYRQMGNTITVNVIQLILQNLLIDVPNNP